MLSARASLSLLLVLWAVEVAPFTTPAQPLRGASLGGTFFGARMTMNNRPSGGGGGGQLQRRWGSSAGSALHRQCGSSSRRSSRVGRGQVRMDFGSDGFLGVGASEVVVIVAVGYFLLGPTELYRLAKEVGKLVTQLRATATEASSTFSEAMESQLAIKEITAASDELQQAFGAAAAPFSAAGRNARMGAKPPPPEPILDEDFDAFGNEEIDNFMKPQEPNSPEGLSESTGAVPDLEAPSYDSNVGGDWWAENNGGSTAQDGVDNKFASQLNGDWNQKVLQGQGPWSEADAAAVADAVGTVPAPATDNNNLGDLDAFGAGYRDAMLAASGLEDPALVEMLNELETSRMDELMRLQQEYDAKRALLDETFALKEEAIQKFAGQKKAVENALEAASV